MSLIHWWPLNGNTNDLGISPCTVTGTPTFNAAGKIGQCLSGGELTMPAAATAQVFNKDAVSICFWLYNGGHGGCIFGTDSMTPPNNRRFSLYQYPDANDLHWSWQNEDSSGTFTSGVKTGVIARYAWSHICAVWDNGTARIYVNGTQVGTSTGTCASTNWAYDTVIARPNNLRYYNDIRIYNHALSAKEVKEISKGLMLHYNFEDEYIESTTNLCNSITPAKYSGWGTITATQLKTNSYSLKNTASNASQLSVWDSWGYDVSSYVGQTITFSAMIKDIQFVNVNNNTSWIAIGQANSGQYPNAITSSGTGNFIKYTGSNSIIKGTRLTWTGIIQEPGRVLFELWTYASSAGGYIQLDLSEIQIEVKDHATPYVNGTRSTGKVYDNSGYGNNGTVNNSLQVIPGGLSGAHYINLPLASTITYTSEAFNKTELTYSIWFRHHGANGSNVTYMFTNGRADYGGLGYGIQIANDSQIVCRYGNSTETVSNCSKDVWHLITVSIKNAVQTIYLDGALVGSFTATVLPSYSDGKGLGLGCFYYNGGSIYHSNCDFADFKIYSTALSADDIKVEYNRKAAIDKKGNLFTGEIIETAGSATKIDKNSFIDSNLFATTMTLEDGSLWAPICVHYVPDGLFTGSSNTFYYTGRNIWENFGAINDLERPESSQWEFYVMQQSTVGGAFSKYRFKQNVSPLSATWDQVNPSKVGTNVTRISATATNRYAGMYWFNTSYIAMCFANENNGNWFGCGARAYWGTGYTPGYNSEQVRGWQLVYMRISEHKARMFKNGIVIPTDIIEN